MERTEIIGWSIIIGFIVLGVALVSVVLMGSDGTQAPIKARSYLAQLYPGKTFRVVCQSSDTDLNSYISCAAVNEEVNGGAPLALECASDARENDSCRIAQPRLNSAE